MIPWTAGGLGDIHLAAADETTAYDCQDGGFDPSSKPFAEKKEKAKEKSAAEKEEFEEKTAEEKATLEKAEKLEGPHQEEPNQKSCPTVDGGCDTGLADLIINQIAVEQQNTVTDPLLDAWQNSGATHTEATDECRNVFALVLGGAVVASELPQAGTLFNQQLNGASYYVNDAFNLAAYRLPYPGVSCLTGTTLVPKFTAPSPVNAGEIVGFDGMESDISLGGGINFTAGGSPQANYATYTWDFGDGSPTVSGYAPGAPVCSTPWLSPCAASEFHSYQYGGTYNVTLTVTDVGGHTTSATNPLTVVGPARPGSPGSVGSGGSGGSGSRPRAAHPQAPRRAAHLPGSRRRPPRHRSPAPRSCHTRWQGCYAAAWLSATRSTSRSPDTSKCCSPRPSPANSACTALVPPAWPQARPRRS